MLVCCLKCLSYFNLNYMLRIRWISEGQPNLILSCSLDLQICFLQYSMEIFTLVLINSFINFHFIKSFL